MYRPNVLKQRLHNGDKLLGCWTMLGHPQLVEILTRRPSASSVCRGTIMCI